MTRNMTLAKRMARKLEISEMSDVSGGVYTSTACTCRTDGLGDDYCEDEASYFDHFNDAGGWS